MTKDLIVDLHGTQQPILDLDLKLFLVLDTSIIKHTQSYTHPATDPYALFCCNIAGQESQKIILKSFARPAWWGT